MRAVTGMAAALALAGCSALQEAAAPEPPATASAAPSSLAGGAAWAQDLTFSGDLTGRVTTIVPNQPGQQSECTGRNSKTGGRWDSSIYVQLSGTVYDLVISASPYRGPGSYPAATVQVQSADGRQVWQTQSGDPVSFTVASDEESGTVDATLTNLADVKTKLSVKGSWTCRT